MKGDALYVLEILPFKRYFTFSLRVYVCDTLHRTTLLPFANTRGTLQMNQRFPFRLDTKNFSQKSSFQLGMLADIANLSI